MNNSKSINKLAESQIVEFKQIWKDEYLKTICAFANGDGGVMYLGLKDDGEILGIDNAKILLETLPNKINNRLSLLVDVLISSIKNRDIIEIKVNRTFAPVSFGGKFYKRSGSNTVELNGSNLTNFLLKKYGKTWDDIAVEEFTTNEIDLKTVKKFKSWAANRVPAIREEDDLLPLLEKLNLYDGQFFKRAAVLLFGKNPQKYFIQSHSKIGKFLSDRELLTSDIIEGNLFEQLELIIDILRTKYLKSFISYDGLNRIETLEYPYEAIREAVINALIHRDYSDTTVLQIRVYDKKIVFSNGATLSPEVPIEKFKLRHISKPFNPLIANIFYKAGFVESWGKGTNNIVDECLNMGMPEPEYKYDLHAVQIVFHKTAQETTQETAQEAHKKGSTKDKILNAMKKNKYITRDELSKLIGVSSSAIKQHLAQLKENGKIERIGSTKSGHWLVIRD